MDSLTSAGALRAYKAAQSAAIGETAGEFSTDFVDGAGLASCYDLLSCWKLVLFDGMRHGDVGDALALRVPQDPLYIYQAPAARAFAAWVEPRLAAAGVPRRVEQSAGPLVTASHPDRENR